MILFKVDAQCVAPLPFERDTPRAVDGNRVTPGFGVQCMQTPARQTQIVEGLGPVQSLKAAANALDQIGADAARLVVEKEVAERFAAEAHYHGDDCKTIMDRYQSSFYRYTPHNALSISVRAKSSPT